jgi:DNA processing protein
LAIASGQSLSQVLVSLTELELEGRVICESGRWLARS